MTNNLPEALKTFRQDFDIRIFVDKNKGNWHMPMEWHTSLEIFLCIRGKGRYYIGNKQYEFEEGDFFVINDSELHKSEIYENGFFDALVIMFSPVKLFQEEIGRRELLNIFYGRMPDFCHMYRPDAARREQYFCVGKLLLEEYEQKQVGYKDGIRALLIWLLTDLNRAYAANDSQELYYVAGEKLKNKRIISETLNYVENHYREDISLGNLAEKLYVTQSYLSREFKKNTGYSMVKFITNRRIREARELLRNTDMSITEVAISVGYNNITHFNAMFKKEIGISPKEFRRQMQQIG